MVDIDYKQRKYRCQKYLTGVDSNIKMNPFYFHICVVNWQGSGKDLLINADIFNMYFKGKSIFDDIISLVFKRPYYKKDIENIYSNCKLNKDVFEDDYYLISNKKDVLEAHDGVLYLHDAELYFKNIGMNMRSENNDMIKFINDKRKDRIFFRMSLHRFLSIHVRVRELLHMWIKPDIFYGGLKEKYYMKDFVINYRVYTCDGRRLCSNVLTNLYEYSGLYDTEEKAKAF